MVTKMNMKQFESEENQAVIRDKLFNIVKRHKYAMKPLAALVGLSDITMTRFLKTGRDVDFKSLCYIDEFVNYIDEFVDKGE